MMNHAVSSVAVGFWPILFGQSASGVLKLLERRFVGFGLGSLKLGSITYRALCDSDVSLAYSMCSAKKKGGILTLNNETSVDHQVTEIATPQ